MTAPVGPNAYTSVMGTGIVAVALVGLPFAVPGAQVVATTVWLLAAVALVAVTAAVVVHHRAHPGSARAVLDDPVMAHFLGAPAMALMTVGAGALLVGHHLLGPGPALAVDAVLWTVGTALGLASYVVVPRRALTRGWVRPGQATGAWLVSVVPPMVSAATGALLLPHVPDGTVRTALLGSLWTCVALALVASVAVTGLLAHRLVGHGTGAAAGVPALFVVLGWLGQSVTAVDHLGAPFAVRYGLPVLAAALVWLLGAAVVVARARPPFSLAWWSFTFPLGTVVTGTSALATTTGSPALRVLAGVLFALLVAAWVVVATRTLHGLVGARRSESAQDRSTEGARTRSGSLASTAAPSAVGTSSSSWVSAR